MLKLPMCGCVLGAKFHENEIKFLKIKIKIQSQYSHFSEKE